ncbi:MAG: MJ0042-type zinc finger domain-containing protein, partial [Pseudomonadota bacterium]
MNIILTCPNCAASFKVKAEALGPDGRTVKCSKCEHRWHATADAPESEETAPEIAEPEAEEAAVAAATDTVASEPEAADPPATPEEEVADEPTAAPF